MENILKTLEFDKVIQLLQSFAQTTLAKQKIASMKMMNSAVEIKYQIDLTDEAKNVLNNSCDFVLENFQDVTKTIDDLKFKKSLTKYEILNIAYILKNSRNAKNFFTSNFKHLEKIFRVSNNLFSNKALEEQIFDVFDSNNDIKDNASETLKSLRQSQRDLENQLKETINKLLNNNEFAKNLQEPIVTKRDSRFVFPVKATCKNKIDGTILDASSSMQTFFIEPKSLTQLNNRIKTVEIEIENEIKKILKQLSEKFYPFISEIEESFNILIMLDVVFAKARMSVKFKFCKCDVSEEKIIDLKEMQNPVLMQVCQNVVKNDFRMDQNSNTIIISGSNTGGKTVVLKTVGLCVLMMKFGLDVPCYQAKIFNFDQIFADIGDNQNILKNLSTFSSHLKNISEIIDTSNANSLVLLDEIASGTDPNEGEALAASVLEFFNNKKIFCLSTTHFSGLKKLAYIKQGFKNASVEFDCETFCPTFKLKLDVPGESHAIAIAKRLGLNNEIIQKAQNYLAESKNEDENIIQKISNAHSSLNKLKENIKFKEMSLEKLEKETLQKLEELKTSKKKHLIAFKKKHQSQFEKAKSQIKKVLEDIDNEENKNKRQALRAFSKIGSIETNVNATFFDEEQELNHKYEDVDWDNIKKNQKIMLKGLNQEAVFIDFDEKKKRAKVQIGTINMFVKKDKLAKFDKNLANVFSKKLLKKQKTFHFERTNIPPSLDLRGFKVKEALETLEDYLDKAMLNNLTPVFVVTGLGLGDLRKSVENFLKTSKYVSKYRFQTQQENPYGCFVIDIS